MRTPIIILAILCMSSQAFAGAHFIFGELPLNGVLNIEDFGAKGDGLTDDTAAIQAAISSACSSAKATPRPPVYFPPTQYPAFYKVTQPILINCDYLTLAGAGEFQSAVESIGYYGPVFLIQQNFNNWSQPFIGNITAVWQANQSFSADAEIKDSNGNIELATTGGASGGLVPSWCHTQGCTTSDNSVTWTLENIGTTWNGNNVFDTLGTTAALGQRNQNYLDLSSVSTPAAINGLSALTVEVEVNPFATPNFYNPILLDAAIIDSQPYNGQQSGGSTGQWDAFGITFSQVPDARCEFAIGGTVTTLTFTRPSFNQYHHIACVFTGAAITAYVDGTQAATTNVSGTISSTVNDKIWLAGSGNFNQAGLPSYIAWARISNSARYTSNFTPPTVVPINDSHTLYLLGFPTAPAVGMVQVEANGMPLYLPYSLGPNGGSPMTTITSMTIQAQGGPVIWADWSYNSHFDHLNILSSDTDSAVLFNSNDFQSSMDHSFVQGYNLVPGNQQLIGLNIGGQSSGFELSDIQLDGALTTAVQGPSGASTLRGVRVTDRGSLIYTFVSLGDITYDTDFIDSEGGNARAQCALYLNNPFAPTTIVGGELDLTTSANGAAYICQNGGQPTIVTGTSLGGSGAAELVNIIANPISPLELRDVNNPGPFTIVNTGKTYWVHGMLSGRDLGMKFAELPSCTAGLNGTKRFLTDGTTGNPCTGGGSGSWADCIGTTWICSN